MGAPKTIKIDEVEYVRKDSIEVNNLADKVDGLKYCVIRTYSAGVHIGYVESQKGKIVKLKNSRRLWHWKGACSLSEVATNGVGDGSKITVVVPEITLTEGIEIIPCTEKAKNCIENYGIWRIDSE